MSESLLEIKLKEAWQESVALKQEIDRLNNYVISGHQIIENEMKAEIEKLKAENAELKDLAIQQGTTSCPSCGEECVNLLSLELYENSQKKEITKLTRQISVLKAALEKIALGESQFDNVDHMYTAREALKECEGIE